MTHRLIVHKKGEPASRQSSLEHKRLECVSIAGRTPNVHYQLKGFTVTNDGLVSSEERDQFITLLTRMLDAADERPERRVYHRKLAVRIDNIMYRASEAEWGVITGLLASFYMEDIGAAGYVYEVPMVQEGQPNV